MRDLDLDKRRGRWSLYLFGGAIALAAGQLVVSAVSLVGAPARPQVALAPLPPPPPRPRPAVETARVPVEAWNEGFLNPPYVPSAGAAIAATPAIQPDRPAASPAPATTVEAMVPRVRARAPQINGRAGPGMQFQVVRRIGPETPVHLTGRRDGSWVEGTPSDAPDVRVWVSLTVVEELPGAPIPAE